VHHSFIYFFVGHGTEELKAIDPSTITLKETCECGNEKIIVTLNDFSEKAGKFFLYLIILHA
jgi:hypothetical protein